jgi:hypothetical protein
MLLLLLLLLLLLTAIDSWLGGSSPYTSTDKTDKNKCIWRKQYKTHSAHNTKDSKYNNHTLQNPHIIKSTHYKTS